MIGDHVLQIAFVSMAIGALIVPAEFGFYRQVWIPLPEVMLS